MNNFSQLFDQFRKKDIMAENLYLKSVAKVIRIIHLIFFVAFVVSSVLFYTIKKGYRFSIKEQYCLFTEDI